MGNPRVFGGVTSAHSCTKSKINACSFFFPFKMQVCFFKLFVVCLLYIPYRKLRGFKTTGLADVQMQFPVHFVLKVHHNVGTPLSNA